jgi:hypothetical protein
MTRMTTKVPTPIYMTSVSHNPDQPPRARQSPIVAETVATMGGREQRPRRRVKIAGCHHCLCSRCSRRQGRRTSEVLSWRKPRRRRHPTRSGSAKNGLSSRRQGRLAQEKSSKRAKARAGSGRHPLSPDGLALRRRPAWRSRHRGAWRTTRIPRRPVSSTRPSGTSGRGPAASRSTLAAVHHLSSTHS